MSFPEPLLEQARHLANRERRRPRQASLRRAVSTAYYALFHLLISEACLNWKASEQRARLARFFEHGRMKSACKTQLDECHRSLRDTPIPGAESECLRSLREVAGAFIDAQASRHTADYDNDTQWTRSQALIAIEQVESAFAEWREIRTHPLAQKYLLSLLGNARA